MKEQLELNSSNDLFNQEISLNPRTLFDDKKWQTCHIRTVQKSYFRGCQVCQKLVYGVTSPQDADETRERNLQHTDQNDPDAK